MGLTVGFATARLAIGKDGRVETVHGRLDAWSHFLLIEFVGGLGWAGNSVLHVQHESYYD